MEAGNKQVIWDSLSIVEFLNECHPDAGLLLRHAATVEFVETAQSEVWVMQHNEFDVD